MKMTSVAGLLCALSLVLPAPARAQTAPPIMQVTDAWSRATAASARNGLVYLSLAAATADELLGASTPVADAAELHRTVNEAGVMKMLPVDTLPIAPGQPVSLQPGGLHLMLMGLKQPLRQGESFPLTLRFQAAPPMTVTVFVQAAGASGPPTAHDTMSHGAMDHGAATPAAPKP